MRILFIGDIVGTPGIEMVRTALPGLIAAENIDVVIANAENSAGGSGLDHDAGSSAVETFGDQGYQFRVRLAVDRRRLELRVPRPIGELLER